MASIEALKLAGDMAMAYPGRSVTEDHAHAWAEALEPLSSSEATEVVTKLTSRSTDPPSVAQVHQVIAEVRGRTMSPGLGGRCVYLDRVECPVCHVIHGHLLDGGTVLHGSYHLGRREMEQAKRPEECDCGFEAPPDVDVFKVLDLIAKGISRVRRIGNSHAV